MAAYLRFAYPNVGYVIDGEEDATVRYGFERGIHSGDLFGLRTPGDTQFAIARIEDVYGTRVGTARFELISDGRNHPADSDTELLERLQSHYPDADIGLDTEVTVIYFNVVHLGPAPGSGDMPEPQADALGGGA